MKLGNNLASNSTNNSFNDRNLSQVGINYPQASSSNFKNDGERNLSQLDRQPGFAASRLAQGGQASISAVNSKRHAGIALAGLKRGAQLRGEQVSDRQIPVSDKAYFSELERSSANKPSLSQLDDLKLSQKLLNKKIKAKELKLRDRLPSHRVHWDEERVKRFEVSSLDKKIKEKRDQINLDDL